jgi:hypothetical protein
MTMVFKLVCITCSLALAASLRQPGGEQATGVIHPEENKSIMEKSRAENATQKEIMENITKAVLEAIDKEVRRVAHSCECLTVSEALQEARCDGLGTGVCQDFLMKLPGDTKCMTWNRHWGTTPDYMNPFNVFFCLQSPRCAQNGVPVYKIDNWTSGVNSTMGMQACPFGTPTLVYGPNGTNPAPGITDLLEIAKTRDMDPIKMIPAYYLMMPLRENFTIENVMGVLKIPPILDEEGNEIVTPNRKGLEVHRLYDIIASVNSGRTILVRNPAGPPHFFFEGKDPFGMFIGGQVNTSSKVYMLNYTKFGNFRADDTMKPPLQATCVAMCEDTPVWRPKFQLTKNISI